MTETNMFTHEFRKAIADEIAATQAAMNTANAGFEVAKSFEAGFEGLAAICEQDQALYERKYKRRRLG